MYYIELAIKILKSLVMAGIVIGLLTLVWGAL